jgi:hypothetical protein
LKIGEYTFVKISHGYMLNQPSFTAKLLGWNIQYVNKLAAPRFQVGADTGLAPESWRPPGPD